MNAVLHDLLSYGYFPKELPPPFTTTSFGAFAANNEAIVDFAVPANFSSHCGAHSLSRSGNLRRRLRIPNPASHFKLCSTIAHNWREIATHCDESEFSISQPTEDTSKIRAFRPRISGADIAIERAKCRANAQFILRADISRFYESIYTHSIPWALYGKEVSKSDRNTAEFKRSYGNVLDIAARNSQDQQTIGIPIGPDSSLIISEIIASSIDTELTMAGHSGIRFMDDYEMAFPTRSAAEKALSDLEVILGEYELALNPLKTMIAELPLPLDSRWSMTLRQYAVERLSKRQEIVDYFSQAFILAKENPHDAVLTFAVARLMSEEFPKDTLDNQEWDLLENLLFQCATVEPGSISFILSILHYDVEPERCSSGLDRMINSILHRQNTPGNGSELAWALWAAILFRRPIADYVARNLDGHPDSIIALLALYARSIGIINQSTEYPGWQGTMTKESLRGDQWLLAYQARKSGWLSSPESHVENDNFFSLLLQNDVSFFIEDTNYPLPRPVVIGDNGY